MGKAEDTLLGILQQAKTDLTSLDTNDNQAIADIGCNLELALEDMPDEMAGLGDLISLCLESLQAIYERSVSDLGRLSASIAGAVTAAEAFAHSEDPVARGALVAAAGQALWMALGRDLSDCPYCTPVADESISTQRGASLDEVASALILLEPTDTVELGKVGESVRAICASGSLSGQASEALQCAALVIDELAAGTASDPVEAMSRVGGFIEAAMNADEFETLRPASTPAPVAEAKPEPMTAPKPSVAPIPEPTEPVAAASAPVQQELLPPDADLELLPEFIVECGEYIEGAEASLLALETDPDNSEAVNTVFRAFHTVKGTSAFLGLSMVSELAHKAENLLSRMRDKEIQCSGGYADLALRSVDTLKDLISAVQSALNGENAAIPAGLDDLMTILLDPEAAGVCGDADETQYHPPRLGDILVAEGKADRQDVEAAAENATSPIGESIVKSKAAPVTEVAKALRTQQRLAGNEQSTSDSSVRVRTDRLDRLIDTVGEMVIAHSMVAQDPVLVLDGNHDVSRKVIHMGKIVRELQYLSMSMRMVPMKATFQKMARLARDVAHKNGKSVEFITEGEDTEIDRNMVDVINDPLVHMVRNAVDHGVETPDVRVENGKSPKGTVCLSAYHSGGNVVVEMRDDGKGLDREKIIQKAVSKGLIESGKGMPDNEVFSLIFEPGFSTADKITDVSGRGVGLDVVKKGVEALRGRIDISSERGKGCTFQVRLPLTLAVTDGMLVKVGDERFIIPTINIHVSFRPDQETLNTVTGRGEMVMLRGEPMPVIRLHQLFGIQGAVQDPTRGLLVILDDGDRRCALLVDELLGQQHVVAKSLGEGVGKIQGVSGGAILGDGRVGLILDPSEIAALAKQPASTGRDTALRVAA
jgi:two-component system chemotaxis sensor kinase CheA